MWKNFLSFSGSQRAGIFLLLILIVLVILLRNLLPFWFPAENFTVTDSTYMVEFGKFKSSLIETENPEWSYNETEKEFHEFSYKKKQSIPYSLFPFDPNIIDSADFVKLGLKPYVASNILKYRKKGGKFRTAIQFSGVWGIDSMKFKELEPYIKITEISQVKIDSIKEKIIEEKNLQVEINEADTTKLMKVKGIGRGFARSITAYRDRLGGFYSLEQLLEIYHMTPEILQRIVPNLTVNPAMIKKIRINSASVEKLKSHPYLNFWQAKGIYELRRRKGKLKDLSELEKIPDLDEKTILKIKIYLDFN